MLAWILEHAGLRARLPGRRRAAQLRRLGAPDATARPSSSRPTNTTPPSSTSAASSSTTGRARRSSTTSSSTTPTSSPTWPRSRRSSTTSCAPCRTAAASSSMAREESLQRVLARGCWSEVRALRRRREDAGTGADWTIAVDGTISCAARRKIARVEWALLGEHNQLNALAAIARGRARRRRPGARPAALAAFRDVARRLELRGTVDGVTVYDDFAHHPTAIARPSTACAARSARAHPRGLRAALEHDEARRDEGAAAVGARGGRPRVLLRGEPRLGCRRGAGAARRAGVVQPTSTHWSMRSRATPGPATTCCA